MTESTNTSTSKSFYKRPVFWVLMIVFLFQCYYINNAFNEKQEALVKLEQLEQRANLAEARLHATELKLQEKEAQLQESQEALIAALSEIEVMKKLRIPLASRGGGRTFKVECTAYEGGGITATGQNLNYRSREEAMCIAVDPNYIPLGSQVRIVFDEPYEHLNGIYTASDTGGAVVGNIVDIYFGHNGYTDAIKFGRRHAYAEILY